MVPHVAVSLVPVLIFLAGLLLIDTYKLVRLSAIVKSVAAGCVAAGIAWLINSAMLRMFTIELSVYKLIGAPLIEEPLKAVWLVWLLNRQRVGFLVDAALHGFAIGTGFALIENLYYLVALDQPSLGTMIVRGFGTAVMHGGVTAIFGILLKSDIDRTEKLRTAGFVRALLAAVLLHACFNQFTTYPLHTTVAVLALLPLVLYAVFQLSERSTREWLGAGFDTDQELLELIKTGEIGDSRIGHYLHQLKNHFPGEHIADMLCLLRLHVELAIRAKGTLMMRENGFPVKAHPDTEAQFAEVDYLEKSIGHAGHLAMLPLLHRDKRTVWELQMLRDLSRG